MIDMEKLKNIQEGSKPFGIIIYRPTNRLCSGKLLLVWSLLGNKILRLKNIWSVLRISSGILRNKTNLRVLTLINNSSNEANDRYWKT